MATHPAKAADVAHTTKPHVQAPDAPQARLPWFWYRIGSAHLQSIRAVDEDAARAAILLAHPHARGQRVEIAAVERGLRR